MFKIFSKQEFQVKYLALLLNLLILRVVFPYLEYLFALFALLSLPMLYADRYNILNKWHKLKNVLPVAFSFFITTLLFILAFLFTDQKSFLVYRELVVALFFIYYLFICFVLLDFPLKTDYVNSFKKQFIAITAIAAVLGLVKFVFDIGGIEFSFLKVHELYPVGTSLKPDHNFYSLGLIIGFVFILEALTHKPSKKWIYNLLLVLFTVNIIFSSSRRGIVLFIILNLVLIFFTLFKKRRFPELQNNLKPYMLYVSICFIFISSGIYIYGRYSGNFNIKVKTASIYNDYRSIIDKNAGFVESYNSLWKSNYIEDWRKNLQENRSKILNHTNKTESGLKSEPVFNSHTGEIYNLESIPGWHRWMAMRTDLFKADSFDLLRIEGYHGGACLYRFIEIDTLVPYLFVSMNIKIERWNKLQRIELRWNAKKTVKHISETMEDGKWHHLTFSSPIDSAERIQLVLYFTGTSPENYGDLLVNGLTLSVHPIPGMKNKEILNKLNQLNIKKRVTVKTVHEILNIDTIPWKEYGNIIMDTLSKFSQEVIYTFSDSSGGSVYKDIVIPTTQFWKFSAKLFVYHAGKNLRIETRNLTYDDYTKGVYYFLKSDTSFALRTWEKLSTYFYAEKGDTIRLVLHLFPDTIPQLIFWKGISLTSYESGSEFVTDKDSIKKINVPAVLHQINNKKALNKREANTFIEPRIVRWQYALELYNHYSVREKITGAGFGYLKAYKNKFPSNYYDVEYPHNIILSVILYSGLFGLVVFIWLMVDTIRFYIINQLNILFLAWLMILSFVFFSSDTIFELPLLTGFTIIPFIYQMVRLKGKA